MTERTGPIITLTAAAVAAIGAIGPWATLGIFTTNGTEGDGVLILILMAITALFAGISLANGANTSRAVLAVILGLIASVTGIYDLINIGNTEAEIFGTAVSPSAGWGIWLTVLGSIGVVIGGIITGNYRPETPEPQSRRGSA